MKRKLIKFISTINELKSFDLAIKNLSKNKFWNVDDLVIDFLKYFDSIEDKKYFLCSLLYSPISELNLEGISYKYPENNYKFEVDNVVIFNEHRIPNNETCEVVETYLYSYLYSILKFFENLSFNKNKEIIISLFFKANLNISYNALTYHCEFSQKDYQVFDLYFNLFKFNKDSFCFSDVSLLKVLLHEFVHILLDSTINKYSFDLNSSYNQDNLLIHEGLASIISKDFECIPDESISCFIENFSDIIDKLKNKEDIGYFINLLGVVVINYLLKFEFKQVNYL